MPEDDIEETTELEPRHGPWIDELEYREWPTPN